MRGDTGDDIGEENGVSVDLSRWLEGGCEGGYRR